MRANGEQGWRVEGKEAKTAENGDAGRREEEGSEIGSPSQKLRGEEGRVSPCVMTRRQLGIKVGDFFAVSRSFKGARAGETQEWINPFQPPPSPCLLLAPLPMVSMRTPLLCFSMLHM